MKMSREMCVFLFFAPVFIRSPAFCSTEGKMKEFWSGMINKPLVRSYFRC